MTAFVSKLARDGVIVCHELRKVADIARWQKPTIILLYAQNQIDSMKPRLRPYPEIELHELIILEVKV